MSDQRHLRDDIDTEIADHLERRVRDLIDAGISDGEARERARLEFGDVGAARRELLRIDARVDRKQRRARFWSGVGADVRTAVRRLAGQPGVTALTVLTLALAIGVAAAVFSVVDQLMLRPPPFPHADRLVDVWHQTGPNGGGGYALQPAKVLGWQEQPSVFERVECYAGAEFDLSGGTRPERVTVRVVSLGLFDMLGIKPIIGRSFAADEGAPGSAKVAIIGHAFWRARFGGSPEVLGAPLVLNDEAYTIIGVLPRNTMLLTNDEPVWLPFSLPAWSTARPMYGFHGVGRLAPGLRVGEARAR